MRDALIGYTGFVGGNLFRQHVFSANFNTKNIHEIIGESFDLVVCAGVKAQKWYANAHPEEDLADIQALIDILEKVEIKRFVLISTIDVYPHAVGVNEDTVIDESQLQAYGKNRLYLEKWVASHFKDHHIVRLPGLFGYGLKKNFLYDLMNPIPALINTQVFSTIQSTMDTHDSEFVQRQYHLTDKGYVLNENPEGGLLGILDHYHFTSLMFTDCEDRLQYYPLDHLYSHILRMIQLDLPILNLAVEPIVIKDLYHALEGKEFSNHLNRPKQNYDMRTKYAVDFGGQEGYLLSKESVVEACQKFLGENRK